MADALNPNIPLNPPREWFTPPTDMPKDAGCIVESNGRVYGYLCHWNSILMDGTSERWKPPRSKTAYSFAHTGDTECDDGSIVKTANLGGDAGHAPRGQNVDDVQAFYENTQTQLARVRYGEDDNGVWFAGVCWPTVTDLDIAKMRASARSGHWCAIGDWRDMSSGRQGFELVGACLVNVPGLKYARADRAASGILTMTPMHAEPIAGQNFIGGFTVGDDGIVRWATPEDTRHAMTKTATQTKQERVAAQGNVAFQEDTDAAVERIPVGGVLVVEGVPTEDGRLIEAGAAEWRELPLPLYASLANLPGHDSAALVGTIDEVFRGDDENRIEWKGTIVTTMSDGAGQATVEAIGAGALRGISIDGIVGPEDWYIDPDGVDVMSRIVIAGATLTPMPAIADASVTLLASNREGFNMADDTSTETLQEDEMDEVVAEESGDDDRYAAIEDKLNGIAEKLETLVGLIESAQLAARYDAAMRRLGE